jgi:uncharacterized YigZ family protein
MESLKLEHPKSRHIVYAYRYINEFDQIVESLSDDGEPKGSSGSTALEVLRGNQLVNTAVLIVRYFGGTKLGIGGLIRAYGKSVNLVLKEAQLLPYIKLIKKTLYIEFTNLSKVEHFLKSLSPDINIRKEFDEGGCHLRIKSSKNVIDEILEFIKDY